MAEESPRYHLGPRSRRGLVAGWRGGQLAAVATGLLAGVVLLRYVGGAGGAMLAFVFVAFSVAFATWPLAGRSAEQWTPVVATHLARRAGVSRRRRSALSTLELDEIPIGAAGRRIGVVVDNLAGTWTAAVRVAGSGFALGDEPDRARRIAAWSGVLAGSAAVAGWRAGAAARPCRKACAGRRASPAAPGRAPGRDRPEPGTPPRTARRGIRRSRGSSSVGPSR